MRLLTWNLDGLEERHLDERTEAACFELLLYEEGPEIVLFQEVVERAWRAHLLPHFGHAGYVALVQPWTGEYGVAILARPPLKVLGAEVVPLPDTEMGRMLLQARLDWDGTELLVQTAHLESLASGARARVAQLRFIAERAAAFAGPAVFAGDTNLRDSEVPAFLEIDDAWRLAGSPAPSATWHPRGKKRPAFRFDRAYLNRWPGWRVGGLRTRGGGAIDEAGGMSASDHLALELTVDRAV